MVFNYTFLFHYAYKKGLVLLDLKENKIGDEGAKYIADALQNNTVSNICLSFAFNFHSNVDSSRTQFTIK